VRDWVLAFLVAFHRAKLGERLRGDVSAIGSLHVWRGTGPSDGVTFWFRSTGMDVRVAGPPEQVLICPRIEYTPEIARLLEALARQE
jgi:hypothetical protein